MAASSTSELRPDGLGLGLEARSLVLGRAGIGPPVVADASLSLAPGECVLLHGATGSGKSTLLRGLAGLRGVERRGGALRGGGAVALMLQHVETQLLCTTIGEEVALGLRTRDLSEPVIAARVGRALEAVGLAGLEAMEVDPLSAGRKQRVLLAALLALEPAVLLLDEPTSALDAEARRSLARTLARYKASGMALLVADHRWDWLEGVFDRALELADGRLRVPLQRRACRAAALPSPDPSRLRAGGAGRSGVVPANAGGARGSGVALANGERVLVTGPNGSGKSSWLRARAQAGARADGAPGEVALVIQEPRRSLFARTVADEVSFSLERRRLPASLREERVRGLLGRFGLEGRAGDSPQRLSFGQQHRLAIAAALAARPALILLDEPFAGLDAAGRAQLLDVLAEEQAETNASLVLASHDRDPLHGWCDRVVELEAPLA